VADAGSKDERSAGGKGLADAGGRDQKGSGGKDLAGPGGKAATDPGRPGLTLEGRLRRLEDIVGQLEAEDLELEKALALFEEGVAHVREAETALSAAELRVEELLGSGEDLRTAPLGEGEG
jgi:exodeoxyribonuclease VII small subunit